MEATGRIHAYNNCHPDDMRWKWTGGPVAEVSVFFLESIEPPVKWWGNSMLSIGPFTVRVVGKNPTRMTYYVERVV